MTVNEFVVRRIREFRIEKGLRVKDVARRAEIPLGSYSCLEGGRYRMSLDILYRITYVLGVEIADVWPAPPGTGNSGRRLKAKEASYWVRRLELQRPKPRPTLQDILNAVGRVYLLSLPEMSSPRRSRKSTEARGMAAILVREHKHLTFVQLTKVL